MAEPAVPSRDRAWFCELDPFGLIPQPIPYETFKKRLALPNGQRTESSSQEPQRVSA